MNYKRRYSKSAKLNQNRLSDRDMLLDLLNTEKSMSHMYDHGIMEATNDTVRNVFEELQHDEHENAYILFNAMQERGWYNTGRANQMSKPYQIRNESVGRTMNNSKYAVTSGSRRFGGKLKNNQYQNAQYQTGEFSNRRITNNSFV